MSARLPARSSTPGPGGGVAALAAAATALSDGEDGSYTELYMGAAGAASWAKPPCRRKANVTDRLRNKTSVARKSFLARVTQELQDLRAKSFPRDNAYAARSAGEDSAAAESAGMDQWGLVPRRSTSREPRAPASCGMFRLARAQKGKRPLELGCGRSGVAWCPV
eukprot:TRINITY_DN77_c3_g1_i1.p2 TRINITY_DN77_c3_g1~~TRINITY_DN77_c3_g1_i1.p2  ORF type:complete len:179 (-),score=26.75 TRINITY_DN77_c3_g1_i1:60-554(-)